MSRKKAKDAPLYAIVDDGKAYIDIDTEFNWVNKELTYRQKLFIFYYTYPINNDARNNGAKSAKLAGFKSKSNILASNLLKKAEIRSEIVNISAQMLEKLTKISINNEIARFIDEKIKRTRAKPVDYYTIEKRKSDKGQEYTVATLKTPDELTEEQKAQILDVEFVGAQGRPHYKIQSKVDAENELIKLWLSLRADANANKDEFEVNTTAEIIKGNLQVKTKVIKSNNDVSNLSRLKDSMAKEKTVED